MSDIEHIFVAFGGTSAMSRVLCVGQSTASQMRRRRSIPVKYWQRLVDAAAAGKIEGVTLETLVRAHAQDANQ